LYGAAGYSFLIGGLQGITTPILYPKETIKGTVSAALNPIKTFKTMRKEFKTNEAAFLGTLAGGFVLTKGLSSIGSIARTGFIGLTSKSTSFEKFLDVKVAGMVASGKKGFPLSTGIKNTLSEFKRGKTSSGTIKVLSASPEPITTLKQSRIITVTKGTGKGRTEGLYAAPYTRGSPFFFRIVKSDTTSYGFSLLPKISQRPTLSVIEVGKVLRIPKSVLSQGVAAENIFLGKAPRGAAYITGNLERRFDPTLPKAFRTGEAEVVIPEGNILRSTGGILGYKESFKYAGERVVVRTYSVTGKGAKGIARLDTGLDNLFVRKGRYTSSSKGITYYTPKKNISLTGSYLKSLYGSSAAKSAVSIGSSVSSIAKGVSSIGLYKSYGRSSVSRSYYPRSITYQKSYSYGLKSYGSIGSLSSFAPGKSYYSSQSLSSSRTGNTYNSPNSPIALTTYKYPRTKISKERSYTKNLLGKTRDIRYRYTPTIEAAVFNIRGKVDMKLARTGLVVRPLNMASRL
jgi:hypothetical protein